MDVGVNSLGRACKELLLIAFAVIILPNMAWAHNFDHYGDLHQIYVDDANLNGTIRFDLEYGDHNFVELRFPEGKVPKVRGTAIAHVVGTFTESSMYGPTVDVESIEIFPLLSGAATTTGVRSALAMRVNFTNSSLECSLSSVQNHLWSGAKNVRGYFEESSFGQVTFASDSDSNGNVDVIDVNLNIPVGTTCDYYGWANAANVAAQAQGVNLSLFKHRIYLLPNNVPCSWAGLGNVYCGGTCQSWSRYCSLVDIIPHELGHNLGLGHAHTDLNNDQVVDCEYCDNSSAMGYGGIGWRHFNAMQKAFLGWIPPEQVTTIAYDGTYQVALSDLNPSSVAQIPPTENQILRIKRPGSVEYYFISFRTSTGSQYNTNLGSTYNNKVNIHHALESGDETNYITSLGAGESYTATGGIQIAVSNISTNYATVAISGVAVATPTPTQTPTSIPTTTVTPAKTPSPTPTSHAPGGNPISPTPPADASPTPGTNKLLTLAGTIVLSGEGVAPGFGFDSIKIVVSKITQRGYRRVRTVIPAGDGSFSMHLSKGKYRLQCRALGMRLIRASRVVSLKSNKSNVLISPRAR